MRVLWVENHAVFARLAQRQFLAAHEVTVVPSIEEAKRALASGTFDAVLVDYDLDDGKGSMLVELVCQSPNRPIVLAASSHDEGNKLLLAAGADACCPKLRFDQIEAVLIAVAARK